MNETRKLVEALIALAGIWLLFRQLPDYASSLYLIIRGSEAVASNPEFISIQSIHFVASVIFGATLILFRKRLASWLVPQEGEIQFQPQALVSVGVAIISVFFILSGVVALGQYFGVKQMPNTSNPYVLWKAIFSIGGGIGMFISSVGISRLWLLLRGRENVGA
jgi:hypothetical protein